MPTYGENGYLDLLKRLVSEWDNTKEISFKVSMAFEERIKNYTPYKVSYHNKTECLKCHSTEMVITKRIVKKIILLNGWRLILRYWNNWIIMKYIKFLDKLILTYEDWKIDGFTER